MTFSGRNGWFLGTRSLTVVMMLGLCWAGGCGGKKVEAPSPPLFGVVAKGDLDEVRRLVEGGADVNETRIEGVTVYNIARIRGYRELAGYLASEGARTNVVPPSGAVLTDLRLESLARPDHPALVVLVASGEEVLYRRAVGMADLENAIPAAPETRFRIGSVTKPFTAAAILRLHERNELKLTDPLSKYHPEVANATNITLHHLLTHTSGLHSYTSKPDFTEKVTEAIGPEALIQYFASDPPDFAPGTRWSYCNSGYFLLGEIVARVSGGTYGAFLQKEFFTPLGMGSTGMHERGTEMGPQALGYAAKEGKVELAKDWHMSWAGGAGALYSTVDDLLIWSRALFGGKVLTGASLDLMLTPVELEGDVEPGPKETGYGYGVVINRQRGLKTLGHSGGLNGFSSMLLHVPEKGLTVVVLSSSLPSPTGLEASELAREIAEFYLWESMEPSEELEVDSSVDRAALDRVAGVYDYGAPVLMSISSREGRVFAQLAGQAEFEIFPRSATEFYWKAVEASISFQTNDQGEVIGAIHRQGGAEQFVRRLADPKGVEVSAELLDGIVGKYDYQSTEMRVTREGNRLFAQLEGQPRLELYASSETNFHWRIVDAHVTFVRDPSGSVIKAIHEQGGRTFEAPRVE